MTDEVAEKTEEIHLIRPPHTIDLDATEVSRGPVE